MNDSKSDRKNPSGGSGLETDPGRRRLMKLAAGIVTGGASSMLVAPAVASAQQAGGRNILIAFYSRTGTTREVANQIRTLVGGELFELRTAHSYPAEYRATTNQAKRELNEGFRPVLATSVANIEAYDTVFIGFPNWWGTLPMAFFTFLEKYKLAGKTVVPFCTHEGSRFGSSLGDIRERCGNARILEGLALRGGGVDRVARDSVREEVARWVHGLGFVPGRTS